MSDTQLIVALTDETYKDFIKEGRVVIRTWDEGCGYCTKYEPVFNEYINETQVKAGVLRIYVMKEKRASEFKRTYMKQDKSENIKETVPGTFVFENGELKARHFGAMTKEQLARLVSHFEAPSGKAEPSCDLTHLKAKAYDLIRTVDIASTQLRQINAQIEQEERRA